MAQFASDSFTDTGGTAIESHSPEIGGGITVHPSYSGGGSIATGNRYVSSGGSTDEAYYAGSPASADYIITFDLYCATNDRSNGVSGRIATGSDAGYFMRYDQSSGNWQIGVNGVAVLYEYGQTLSILTAYTNNQLKMVSNVIQGYVAGVLRLNSGGSTDSSVSAAGKAGVRGSGGETSATGYHIDNLSADDVSAGASITPSAGALVFVGLGGILGLGIAPQFGSLIFSGTSSILGRAILTSVGSLSVSGTAPLLDFGLKSTAGTLTIFGNTPTQGIGVAPSSGTLTFNGLQASVTLGLIAPGAGTLTFNGLAPTLSVVNPLATIIITTQSGVADSYVQAGTSDTFTYAGVADNDTQSGGVG